MGTPEIGERVVSIIYTGNDPHLADELNITLCTNGLKSQVVRAQPIRSEPVVVALLVILAIPLHNFLAAFGSAAGQAAGERLAAFFRRAFANKADGVDEVVLRDGVNGIDIYLHPHVPPGAYEELWRLVTSAPGVLRYDQKNGAWFRADQ